jgi:dethiobiotin synthetase
LLQAIGKRPTLAEIERVSPFRYKAPLAPNLAAVREGRRVDFSKIVKACKEAIKTNEDRVLIEGIGGLMVPLDNERTVLGLIEQLRLPALLVTGSYLGTISHTLTALEVAQSRRIKIAAVVISESEQSSVSLGATAAALRKFVTQPIVSIPRGNPAAAKKAVARLAEIL